MNGMKQVKEKKREEKDEDEMRRRERKRERRCWKENIRGEREKKWNEMSTRKEERGESGERIG